MEFDVFTLLPEVFPSYLESSILQRASQHGLIEVRVHNIRDWATEKHHVTDDEPYGGGGGMVMKVEPVFAAVESVLGPLASKEDGTDGSNCPIILLTPQGRVFQPGRLPRNWSQQPRLALILWRYEGFDERIREYLATDQISIGDYVLTGGELPALILIDAVARLLPAYWAIQTDLSMIRTRRACWNTRTIPARREFRSWGGYPRPLLSGNHARESPDGRREQSLRRTLKHPPDLLEKANLERGGP